MASRREIARRTRSLRGSSSSQAANKSRCASEVAVIDRFSIQALRHEGGPDQRIFPQRFPWLSPGGPPILQNWGIGIVSPISFILPASALGPRRETMNKRLVVVLVSWSAGALYRGMRSEEGGRPEGGIRQAAGLGAALGLLVLAEQQHHPRGDHGRPRGHEARRHRRRPDHGGRPGRARRPGRVHGGRSGGSSSSSPSPRRGGSGSRST